MTNLKQILHAGNTTAHKHTNIAKNFSFIKFTTLFLTYLIIMNFTFFKGVFYGFLEQNSPVFSVFFMVVLILIYSLVLVVLLNLTFLPYTLKPFAIFCILVSGISSYFISKYGVIIDGDMLKNVIGTDKKEVFGYLTPALVLWNFCFVFLPIFLIMFAKIDYKGFKTELKIRTKVIMLTIICLVFIFSITSKIFIPFFREHKELRFYTLPFYPIYSGMKILKELNKNPLPFENIALDATRSDNEKKIFVFIVGETQRSANYSLNGYLINETNFYTKNQNIVSFTQFYSCATATKMSLPCMFSDLKRDEFSIEKAKSRSNLIDFINMSKIDTFWFDNNSGGCQGVCNKMQNVKEFYASNFDNVIFDEAKNIIKNTKDTAFIVLHIQGSHGPVYFKDYPKDFKKFMPTCDTAELNKCSSHEIADTYDNTILYQDFLQNEIINSLKEREDDFKTAMFFVSDHGESLGENGVYLHGMPYVIAPNHQKHIPAIFYSSDENLVQKLNQIKDKELSHDYIFSSILGFFGVKTTFYDEKFDIFK